METKLERKEAKEFIKDLKKASHAVYLACDEKVANDLSRMLLDAAIRLEQVEKQCDSPQLSITQFRGAIRRAINAVFD